MTLTYEQVRPSCLHTAHSGCCAGHRILLQRTISHREKGQLTGPLPLRPSQLCEVTQFRGGGPCPNPAAGAPTGERSTHRVRHDTHARATRLGPSSILPSSEEAGLATLDRRLVEDESLVGEPEGARGMAGERLASEGYLSRLAPEAGAVLGGG